MNLFPPQWKITGYALFASIGAMVGGLIVNPSRFVVYGALSVLVVAIIINCFQVLYKKFTGNPKNN